MKAFLFTQNNLNWSTLIPALACFRVIGKQLASERTDFKKKKKKIKKYNFPFSKERQFFFKMSQSSGENESLSSVVNCYADENLNLLSILGMLESPSKKARKERPKVKKEAEVPFKLVWKRTAGLSIVPHDLGVQNGLAVLSSSSSVSAKNSSNPWIFARMKGYLSSGELLWTLRLVDGNGLVPAAAGIEDRKGAMRIFDFQTGNAQDELNRQEHLFECTGAEMSVHFRMSFLDKKLWIAVDQAPFKPAFRLTTGAGYAPVIAFAGKATIEVTKMEVRE